MYEWLHRARLATVLDCWHTDWVQKVYVWFQLTDFDVEPQDKSLPIYKIYTKFPFWWVVDTTEQSPIIPLLKAYGWKWWDVLSFLLENIWEMVMLNIVDNEYQWKLYPLIANEWHQPYPDSPTDVNLFDWWTALKTFKFTTETTKEDIDAIWFENKVIKKSDEYKSMTMKDVSQEEIDTLF